MRDIDPRARSEQREFANREAVRGVLFRLVPRDEAGNALRVRAGYVMRRRLDDPGLALLTWSMGTSNE
jgi:hypothetical protein